ncbi:hypothetical protein AB670_02549 [Chryseobacterium sp. MOF25P]|nr:hypothetical protein AB670_02549 [Chryseobacterium sp. MOF25P]OBW45772.1 hypothetical protein AB671_02180 [Chryseobacterium sp. BGARF1]
MKKFYSRRRLKKMIRLSRRNETSVRLIIMQKLIDMIQDDFNKMYELTRYSIHQYDKQKKDQ